jgi:hypothetical protein
MQCMGLPVHGPMSDGRCALITPPPPLADHCCGLHCRSRRSSTFAALLPAQSLLQHCRQWHQQQPSGNSDSCMICGHTARAHCSRAVHVAAIVQRGRTVAATIHGRLLLPCTAAATIHRGCSHGYTCGYLQPPSPSLASSLLHYHISCSRASALLQCCNYCRHCCRCAATAAAGWLHPCTWPCLLPGCGPKLAAVAS